MRYFLAIDIGASSGRHLLFSLKDGRFISEEIYRFQNLPKTLDNGSMIWDTDRLFSEILNGLRACKAAGKIPYSVAIDTWGVDYALLDENDKLIDSVYCYRDERTQNSIPLVHDIIPFEQLYEIAGTQFNSFNTVYQLFCDKLSGKMEKAKTFLMLPNYFMFLLTGIKRQEYTNATTTGIINATTHTWDEDIIHKLDYKRELFTALTQPGELVGSFSKSVSEAVGFSANVIMPATHDTASAVIAAPLDGRTPYISSGTWSLLGVEDTIAHTDRTAMNADYSNEGSIDFTVRLQKNIMGLWMIQQVRHEAGDIYSFEELAEMARACPVDHEIDVNSQRFLAPKSMRDEIANAVGKPLSIGETAYVIYNNLAKFYATSLKALEQITDKKYNTLNIIGGGSKNALLNELTAKYTDKKIITGPTECTAIGNIIMQMIGAGEITDVNEGRQIVKRTFDIGEIS